LGIRTQILTFYEANILFPFDDLFLFLVQGLSPIVGFLGMFIVIACCSAVSGLLTLYFPACPSPRKILERLDRARVDL
jgi:hypothetical protein